MKEYVDILKKIRDSNINSEIYPGEGKLKKQMEYANKIQSPGVIFYGDDEIKLPTFARDLPLYWKLKAHAGEEDEVMTASPVSTHVFKQKKRKRGPRKNPGGFR